MESAVTRCEVITPEGIDPHIQFYPDDQWQIHCKDDQQVSWRFYAKRIMMSA